MPSENEGLFCFFLLFLQCSWLRANRFAASIMTTTTTRSGVLDFIVTIRPAAARVPEVIESCDVDAELIKLDNLRKRGILADAEFEAQKKKLVSGN